MAAGIADLGNGIGYIWKTKLDNTTIVGVEKNTVAGVQAMIQSGLGNAPLIAERVAYGKINVTASTGAGSITAITINGVNQIGGTITVVSINTNVVAEQIATALNAFTPAGYQFTAQIADGASTVFLYSTVADAVAVNGLTITITSTGITTTTVPFVNGSNDVLVDDTWGYNFWLYADASAVPNTRSALATLVTPYFTLRGTNTGIITLPIDVVSDSLPSVPRLVDTMQVLLGTQGAVATDILGYITTQDFVDGDVLRIRSQAAAQVVTIQDVTVNTTVPTPNIYLTNQSSFALTGTNSIMLQMTNHPTLGPIWVEIGRTSLSTSIPVSSATFLADLAASALKTNTTYYLNDLLQGTYITTITSNNYSPYGVVQRWTPNPTYVGWRTTMAVPSINQKVRYKNNVYNSLTGVVGTDPDTDTTNWAFVPYASPHYTLCFNDILLSSPSELNLWPVLQETDGAGNVVKQDFGNYMATGYNAYNLFRWATDTSNNQPYGNYVHNAVFNIANTDGLIYNNVVKTNSLWEDNVVDASTTVSYNILDIGSQVTNNNFRSFVSNQLSNQAVVSNNFNGANKAPKIENNVLIGGSITNNFATGNAATIEWNRLDVGSQIISNTLNANGIIYGNKLTSDSFITNCNLKSTLPTGHIKNCTLSSSVLTYNQYAAGDPGYVAESTFISSSVLIDSLATSAGIGYSNFNNCQISSWRQFGASESNFTNCDITGELRCLFDTVNIRNWVSASTFDHTAIGTISNAVIDVGIASNLAETLDTANATIFAANVLTIPYNMQLAGRFSVVNTAATPTISISQIVNLPLFLEVRMFNTSTATAFTFTKTAPASFSGNQILGAANRTINITSGIPDFISLNKTSGRNMIIGGVNFI